MGLGDFFKDQLGMKKEEPTLTLPKKEATTTTSKQPVSIKASVTSPIATSISNSTELGTTRKEFVDYFAKLWDDNDIQGPDYYEFINSLEKMKTKPMDDNSKFNTVFDILNGMGMTREHLISTAQQYRDLFTSKKESFENQLLTASEKTIGTRQSQIAELQTANDKINEQMAALNKQKIANDETMQKLNSEVQDFSNQLTSQQKDFNATYTQFVESIDKNVKLINEYINI